MRSRSQGSRKKSIPSASAHNVQKMFEMGLYPRRAGNVFHPVPAALPIFSEKKNALSIFYICIYKAPPEASPIVLQ